ncbi:MAG: hypothetical protein Q7U54_16720 [Bacteroidales bacterium]|nr:hypothetical protein [Bacteroidales bacterium]
MKNLLIVLLFSMPIFISAQTKEDIINPKVPLVFFGADFTQVQFTRSDEFNNKPEILRFFLDINNMFTSKHTTKYIEKGLKRNEIKTDYSYVIKNNELVEWEKVYSDNIDYSLSDEIIENMIKKLNIDQGLYKDHIGMVLCEENYCKTKPLGTVAVVFFGINDLKTIFIKRYSIKPSGYGFLYYWGSINWKSLFKLNSIYKEVKK